MGFGIDGIVDLADKGECVEEEVDDGVDDEWAYLAADDAPVCSLQPRDLAASVRCLSGAEYPDGYCYQHGNDDEPKTGRGGHVPDPKHRCIDLCG